MTRRTLERLLQWAAREQFSILAYCFMPDHVHVLVEALAEDSCLTTFITRWQQGAGYDFRRVHDHLLWQDGYHDRILRDDDDVVAFAAYLLDNPVRAGLVSNWDAYPFSGSVAFSRGQIAEAVQFLRRRANYAR